MTLSPIVYHGTFANFEKFDKSKLGSVTGSPSAFEGFFFSSNKNVAISYASDLTKQLTELSNKADEARKKIENLTGDSYHIALFKAFRKEYSNDIKEKVYELNNIITEYEDLESGLDNLPMGYDEELDESGVLKVVQLYLENPLIYDMKGEDYRSVAYVDLILKAKLEGHDSVIIKNTYDGRTPVGNLELTDIYVVFDESQIISIENENSKNIF